MAEEASNTAEAQREEAPDHHPSPVIQEVASHDASSAVAVAGHPIHAMMVHFPIALVFCVLGADGLYWVSGDEFWLRVGVWACGGAFVAGVVAAMVGTAELLLVPGIRIRVASWNHAVVALVLLAILAANWGLRLSAPEQVLPHGLLLSLMGAIATGFAGWHGGKLVLDHGVGLIVSSKN